jgi:hypothetical protein
VLSASCVAVLPRGLDPGPGLSSQSDMCVCAFLGYIIQRMFRLSACGEKSRCKGKGDGGGDGDGVRAWAILDGLDVERLCLLVRKWGLSMCFCVVGMGLARYMPSIQSQYPKVIRICIPTSNH